MSFSSERYRTMKYNFCGKSGLKLPAVSLGLWHNFGFPDKYEVMEKTLSAAFNCGITHFDLANNYGPPPGSAEENFGRILASTFKGYRDELIISTKAGYGMWPGPYGNGGSRKYLLASLDQSLLRMGLDYVDIFYSHRFDPDTPLEETMGALASAYKSGKALYVGISNYGPSETRKAVSILRDMGVNCLIHQFAYNMFDRKPEDGLIDALDELGVGSIAFCPLAQGILTDRYLGGIPEDSRASKVHGYLQKDSVDDVKIGKVRKLNEIAKARDLSLAQLALLWDMQVGRLTSVLIGASRPEQVLENVKMIEATPLSTDELKAIDEILV